jgi:serine/threonine protein kinase
MQESLTDVNMSKAFDEFRRECWIMRYSKHYEEVKTPTHGYFSALQHPNIVTLKGLCMDPLCIVTEFLPHGNLYEYLGNSDNHLDWPLRLKIALGIPLS